MLLAPSRDDLRPANDGGVSLWYIATRAGCSGKSGNWILNYVRLLVANEGFPKPLPYYGLGGARKSGIHIHSRWLRAAVDAWFGTFLPPQLASVLDEASTLRDAGLLDQRADQLAGVAAFGGSHG